MLNVAESTASYRATLDVEHRVQVGLIDALCDAVESGKPEDAVTLILEQLVDYSKAHFMSEELLMRLDSYSGFDEHVSDHAHMIEALEALSGSQMQLIPGQARALLSFLIRHIETRDASYASSPRV